MKSFEIKEKEIRRSLQQKTHFERQILVILFGFQFLCNSYIYINYLSNKNKKKTKRHKMEVAERKWQRKKRR